MFANTAPKIFLPPKTVISSPKPLVYKKFLFVRPDQNKPKSFRGFSDLRTKCPYKGVFSGYNFGEILQLGKPMTLDKRREYTITLQFKDLIMPSESTVYEGVNKALGSKASITSLDRGLFSSSFAITFIPSEDITAVNSLFNQMRQNFYPKYDGNVVQVETGTASSKPGGAVEAVKSGVKKITAIPVAMAQGSTETLATGASNVAIGILKGAWPVLAIGAVGLFGYLYVSSGAAKRRVAKM